MNKLVKFLALLGIISTANAAVYINGELKSQNFETNDYFTFNYDQDTKILNSMAFKDQTFDEETTIKLVIPSGTDISENFYQQFPETTNCNFELSFENDVKLPSNCSNVFWNCPGLTSLDLSKLDTSNVTNMSHMFGNCFKLNYLDISQFDTSEVTDMAYMFGWCHKLSSLDISSFNTSKVTNMHEMFAYCRELSSLTVSDKFVIQDETNTSEMFDSCDSLLNPLEFKKDNEKYYLSKLPTRTSNDLVRLLKENHELKAMSNEELLFETTSETFSLAMPRNNASYVIGLEDRELKNTLINDTNSGKLYPLSKLILSGSGTISGNTNKLGNRSAIRR